MAKFVEIRFLALLGLSWAGLGLFFLDLWPFWLPLAWPRRRRMPKRCLRGRCWYPFGLQKRCFVDSCFALRASVSMTFFDLFPTRRCFKCLVLSGLREKRANGFRPTKTKGFSLFFAVGCFAGRVPRKQKEGENQSPNPDPKNGKNN